MKTSMGLNQMKTQKVMNKKEANLCIYENKLWSEIP